MGRIALIVDAGPLYATVDVKDRHHAACRELLESHRGPLVVPTLVVSEVEYMIATRLGTAPEVLFLAELASGDWLRIAELVGAYRDLPLGTVDASVVATAERLGERSVATLDRRHFTVVRPAHTPAFDLLP